MTIPEQSSKVDESAQLELENLDTFLQPKQNEIIKESKSTLECSLIEGVIPSAPILLDRTEPLAPLEEDMMQEEKSKIDCMSLDEAIRLYCGTEMAMVMDVSAREEAEVEAGPNCAPEHPLVDLLSTFRYLAFL